MTNQRGVPSAFRPKERIQRFPVLRAMSERVLVWDGAMGTMIQEADLTLEDFDGKDGCNELLCVTRPDVIADIHRHYFASGADIVETNSFGSTSLVLAEYDLQDRAFELNEAAARIARTVADEMSTDERPRFVAGSMGPTTRLVTLGHVDYDDLHAFYQEQARGLIRGGVDLLQIETCQDLLQIKCAVAASREAMEIEGREVPILVTITVETTGTMLVGSDVGAALATIEALPVDIVGLNCATGPDLMQEHVRFLGERSTRMVAVLPNAGLPRNVDGRTVYDLVPAELAAFHRRFVLEYGVTAVGGCCGTTPAHIEAIAKSVRGLQPRERPDAIEPEIASLYSAVPLDQDSGPLIIGERTNANGSRLFREQLLEEDWDALVEIGKGESKEGAHALDVCTAYVGRDEVRDMSEVVSRFVTQVPCPIVVDSTQLDVLESALKLIGGRPVINSINLEDGESKADEICRLARHFGCAMIALTIDEEGMAKTKERKLEVAKRIHDIVTKRHGLPSECLLFDPLTFTIASGDEDSRDAAIQTLEGLRAIKEALAGVRTLLGLSNVSFGLKPYPRRVLNSVFLGEAREHGLDAAIMNGGKIIPLHTLDDDDLKVTRDLIYDRRDGDYDPLFAFIDRFAGRKSRDTAGADEMSLSVEERLKNRIIDGNRTNLEPHLAEAMKTHKPLDIINTILLDGMKVVGELFGSGQMQLPFVLQSAETMKAAVKYLEPHMEKVEGATKGTMVIATVRGDVHDIGKNLVDIILSNNGYTVVNLGIKQPLENILEACDKHKADVIGMSGLLVKSTVVMKENLELMAEKGITVPVVCGGAALNRGYVEKDLRDAYAPGKVYYGRDAFTGLHLMDELCGTTMTKTLTAETSHRVVRHETRAEREARLSGAFDEYVEPTVARVDAVPEPPFWGQHVVPRDELDLGTILRYINKTALFRGQWQYKRGRKSAEEFEAQLRDVVTPKFEQWAARAIADKMLEPGVVHGYWPCNADKNDVVVFDAEDHDREIARFRFPRQPKKGRLCLADFFLPLESGKRDVAAFQVVTMGEVASKHCTALFEQDRYDEYLHFYGLSVEAAEALAEYWHKRVRQQLSISGDDALELDKLFAQGYRGSRFSFGYPACPVLQDQVRLFSFLDARAIGVSLTDEWQLVPEQSTSAIICHHPEARYFNVGVGA
ncbi:MAG: methionine synthase [Planctomycetes bacterium]|nr:methionine synthase [Planctomycetota bacterium]MCB9916856.1 methionine synthase [Planctomycetota bacterium]